MISCQDLVVYQRFNHIVDAVYKVAKDQEFYLCRNRDGRWEATKKKCQEKIIHKVFQNLHNDLKAILPAEKPDTKQIYKFQISLDYIQIRYIQPRSFLYKAAPARNFRDDKITIFEQLRSFLDEYVKDTKKTVS